jgi:hypothetical protein
MNSRNGLQGPVNLGNPGEFTILELAHKIIDITGSGSSLDFRPLPPDDPRQRQPDITLAKTELGWQPKVSLDEGLRKTIEYFDALLGLSSPLKRIGIERDGRHVSSADRRVVDCREYKIKKKAVDRRLGLRDRRYGDDKSAASDMSAE